MNNTGKKQHPGKAVIAGGVAGAIEACISYPTECVPLSHTAAERRGARGLRGPRSAARQHTPRHRCPARGRFVKTKLQLFDMGKQGPIQVAKETVAKDGAWPRPVARARRAPARAAVSPPTRRRPLPVPAQV